MTSIFINFTEIHHIIALILLSYGVVGGFRNTYFRVLSILGYGRLSQSDLGGLTDLLFYAGTGYLTLVHYGII